MPKKENGYWSDRMRTRHALAVRCCMGIAKDNGINLVEAFATCERGRLLTHKSQTVNRNKVFRHMFAKGFTTGEIARACEVSMDVVARYAMANGWSEKRSA